jgi:putative DNA primase/helicase
MKPIPATTAKEAAGFFAKRVKEEGYEAEALHEYTGADGKPIYWRIRAKHPDTGDKWIRPMHLTKDGYVLGEPEFKNGKPLYNLPVIVAGGAVPVFVVEGEWCADKLSELGITSTTSGSSSSAEGTDWRPIARRRVIIWPDNDEAGRVYAKSVAALLTPLGCDVTVVDVALLDLPPKGDAVDWCEKHPDATREDAIALITTVEGHDSREVFSGLDAVLKFCNDCELFTDDQDRGYAAYAVGCHREVHPITGRKFAQWLQQRYFEHTGKGLRPNILADALPTILAKANFEGEVRRVYKRVAFLDGRVVVDICNADWHVIEVSDQGWEVKNESPVVLTRAPGMLALTRPERDGDISLLRKFVNMGDDDFVLLVGWLLAALRGQPPYPVLVLGGEEGSGKSSLAMECRRLVDPSATPLSQLPKNDQDLFIRANNSYILAFDNLSSIAEAQSDSLCRISTGGGISTRKLYTDDEEANVSVARPIIVNGIGEIATRQDLLSRSLVLSLPPLDSGKSESEFWREFDGAAPRILGALLDAMVLGLRDIDSVRATTGIRLIDITRFMTAAEPALGWNVGTFEGAYRKNQLESVLRSVEASPFANAVWEFIQTERHWLGTASGLLEAVERPQYTQSWPKTPAGASAILNRYAKGFRRLGVSIESTRTANERQITLRFYDANDADDALSLKVSKNNTYEVIDI